MTSTERTQDEAQIRELMTEWEAGVRAKDAKRLVSRFAPEIVQFTLAPPLKQANADDPGELEKWFAGFEGPMDYEVRDLTITAGEDVAFCHSLNCLSATPQGSPQGFELWLRSTVGLRKIDGEWRITHEHTSTPFYMDGSFRSAVDLKP
jgi:ketosteroid isomerase-like protein